MAVSSINFDFVTSPKIYLLYYRALRARNFDGLRLQTTINSNAGSQNAFFCQSFTVLDHFHLNQIKRTKNNPEVFVTEAVRLFN